MEPASADQTNSYKAAAAVADPEVCVQTYMKVLYNMHEMP